jgi:hypothetical protein
LLVNGNLNRAALRPALAAAAAAAAAGYLPFDDRRNPNSPALSLVWRAILTEEPSFK